MSEGSKKQGRVVIVSGPSGVGKSTVCKEVAKRTGSFLSVSVTARTKTKTEVDGGEYWFVSKDDFRNQIEQNRFLEYAEVFGNLYGTPREPVEKALQEGKTVILEIDAQGAQQVKTIYPNSLMIFILPPDQRELAHRLTERGRDSTKVTEQRLDGAGSEIAAAWQYYQNMVINDELEQAVNEVLQIIKENIAEKSND